MVVIVSGVVVVVVGVIVLLVVACSRSEMVVESRSVIRNAKNARGLGRDTAPFPKSCASYFRFARFNTFPLYYLRA